MRSPGSVTGSLPPCVGGPAYTSFYAASPSWGSYLILPSRRAGPGPPQVFEKFHVTGNVRICWNGLWMYGLICSNTFVLCLSLPSSTTIKSKWATHLRECLYSRWKCPSVLHFIREGQYYLLSSYISTLSVPWLLAWNWFRQMEQTDLDRWKTTCGTCKPFKSEGSTVLGLL